jgi:hypothetical protein
MQIGGFGPSASAWLGSVGKTTASEAIELFSPTTKQQKTGQKEQAELAATRMTLPTLPPAQLGAEALLVLQDPQRALAQSDPTKPLPTSLNAEPDLESLETSAADQFLDYMKKTPEERLRDKILKALGLTEEDVANMSPDERIGLEKKIRDIIKETIVKAEGQGEPERDRAGADALQQKLMLETI